MGTQPIVHEQLTITLLDEHLRYAGAVMSGTDNHGILRVELPEPLKEGAAVRVTSGDAYSTTGRVLYSVPVNGSHYATIRTENERRADARISVSERAGVTSMQRHISIACQARVIDVSRTGIGLIVPARLNRDLLLKIVLESAIVFGEVRHCVETVDPRQYYVGVEIQTVIFRDSRKPSKWLLAPKVLWASVSLRLQAFTARMKRGPVM